MDDQERMNAAVRMSADERAMVMMGAAQMTQEVNETIAGMSPAELQKAAMLHDRTVFLGSLMMIQAILLNQL